MRRRLTAIAASALLLLLSLLLAACGGSSGESSSATGAETTATGTRTTVSSTEGKPKSGGTLVVADNEVLENLDPAVVGGILSAQGFHPMAIYDALLYEMSGSGEVKPGLAESLKSSDGVTWTLTLRKGVQFSDGTPFDAEAVKYNWERIAKGESASATAAQGIKSMKVVDATHMQVILKAQNGQFDRVVAERLPFIGSPTAIKKSGEKFGLHPVGAGPFILEKWTPGEMRLTRNPHYWDAPRPYLDKLVFKTIAEGQQRYNTISTGGAQLMSVEEAYNEIPHAKEAGLEVAEVPGSGGIALPLNVAQAPFNNLTARRALNAAIDREGLVETVLGGVVQPFTNLYSTESPFHEGAQWPQFEPEEAQQLLDEYAKENGGPLEFTFLFAQGFEEYGEYLETELSQFENLKVTAKYLAPTAFFERLATGNFEASVAVPSWADPDPLLGETLGTGGARNFGKFSNKQMDAALAKGQSSSDQAVRAKAYAEVQKVAIEEMPYVWLTQYGYDQIYVPALKGLEWVGGGVPLWDALWLDE